MSHYFHIKKKSIIISALNVQDAIKIRTQHTSACVTRDSLRKLQFSKLTPKKYVESAHTKPRRSMIAICFGIRLSFTMSSMLCVQGVRVLHNKDFESTLLSSNIRPILFEFCDLQYVHSIQYGTTLHFTEYWKRPERQRLSRRPRAIILDNS